MNGGDVIEVKKEAIRNLRGFAVSEK